MARIPGVGLAKGLSITLRHMLRKSVTQQYPQVKPDLPPRSRGVIALVEENCTSCMLCARECPDWCIYIDSHKETLPAPEGGRARQRNVLDRFAIDFALCMYCGICIEVCPFDALFWSPEFEYAEGDIRNLLHEKDQLAAWAQTVPPPPAHDPAAEPPKELTAAPRRPRPANTPSPGTATAASRGTTGAASPGPASPAGPADPSAATPAEQPEPGTESPPTAGPERPRRSMSNVRGIRPPGSLPPPDTAPGSAPPASDTTPPADTAPSEASSTGDTENVGRTQGANGTNGAEDAASSTGRPSGEELSTGGAEAGPAPGEEGQTSPARPPRRKMADPRSIRPPGRLDPEEPREPEEES